MNPKPPAVTIRDELTKGKAAAAGDSKTADPRAGSKKQQAALRGKPRP